MLIAEQYAGGSDRAGRFYTLHDPQLAGLRTPFVPLNTLYIWGGCGRKTRGKTTLRRLQHRHCRVGLSILFQNVH